MHTLCDTNQTFSEIAHHPDDPRSASVLTNTWRALVTIVGAVNLFAAACGGGPVNTEPIGKRLEADVGSILEASAATMGATTSVAFKLERSGAPVYIDTFNSISLNRIDGQFKAPRSAQAVLEVEVNGNLTTELAAIAVEENIWLSNPVTGAFEPLPPGVELDPSMFFNPDKGWKPLMSNLTDATLHGLVDRGGSKRYHLTATALADQVEIITAGLVRDVEVDINFWLQPVSGAVMAAEFTTEFPEGEVDWNLMLSDYGADFKIQKPEDLPAVGAGDDPSAGDEPTPSE